MISSQTQTPKKPIPRIIVYCHRGTGVIHIYDEQLKLYRYGIMTEQNAIAQFRIDTHQKHKQLDIVRIMP